MSLQLWAFKSHLSLSMCLLQIYSTGQGAVRIQKGQEEDDEDQPEKEEDGSEDGEEKGALGVAGYGGGVVEETPDGTIGDLIAGIVNETGGANIDEAVPPGSIVDGGVGTSPSLKRCVVAKCR